MKIEDCIETSSKYIRWLSKKYKVNDDGEREDLYQEGVLSLYNALKNYKSDSGSSFLRFADFYIKASMHRYIQNNSGVVKYATTKGRRNLFVNSRKIDRDNYNVEELKKRYKCSDTDIRDFMSRGEVYLSDYDDSDELLGEVNDTLDEVIDDQEWELYSKSYDILSERELSIIKSRLSGVGLKELSKEYGVSMERIRQIEFGGIQKMVKYCNN